MSWSVTLPILVVLNLLALMLWLAGSPLRLVLVGRLRSAATLRREEAAERQSESYDRLLAAALNDSSSSVAQESVARQADGAGRNSETRLEQDLLRWRRQMAGGSRA